MLSIRRGVHSFPFYYGWVIAGIAAMGMFFSGPGQTFSISIFLPSYLQEFGWSRTFVSALYSGASVAAGLCMILVGKLTDRFGCRRVGAAVAFLLGLACLWNSIVHNEAMLFSGFFLVRLLGQGAMMLVPAVLVSHWFVRRRGRAFSVLSLGMFAGTAVIPPLNTWLISQFGWVAAWQIWAMLLWVLFVPMAVVFIRNRPEDCGLQPDRTDARMEPDCQEVKQQEEEWTLAEACGQKAFYFLLICTALPPMLNTGLNFHLLSILGERSIAANTAAYVLSASALAALPVSLLSGLILDRVKAKHVLAFMFVLQIGAIAMILRVHSPGTALLFGVVWGMASGMEGNCFGTLYPKFFGRKHIGSIRGISMIATVLGSALGPLPFGAAFDHYGGYTEILLLSLALPAAGMVLALLSNAPVKRGGAFYSI